MSWPNVPAPEESTAPTVSSMAEQLRPHVRDVQVIPAVALPHWLPGLGAPTGWKLAPVDLGPQQPARVLVLPAADGTSFWDGCEVLNLFRFSGTAPDNVVRDSADRTLQDLGVVAPFTHRITMPPGLGIVATRSRGIATIGQQRLWVQVTNFMVTTSGDGALIEHTILVPARSRTRLAADIRQLGDGVRLALLTSVRDAAKPLAVDSYSSAVTLLARTWPAMLRLLDPADEVRPASSRTQTRMTGPSPCPCQ